MRTEDLTLPNFIRCYDGVYDSATQRVLDRQEEALRQIQEREPGAHVTYFPVEERYVVHVWGRNISGYHTTRGGALADAYGRLYP